MLLAPGQGRNSIAAESTSQQITILIRVINPSKIRTEGLLCKAATDLVTSQGTADNIITGKVYTGQVGALGIKCPVLCFLIFNTTYHIYFAASYGPVIAKSIEPV